MSWITTYTGRRFYPLAPRPQDVCLEDIAHALSMKCRWTGHVRTFYSVAEHSVRVARLLNDQGFDARVQLAGLLHDATEAYLPDVASPIKGAVILADLTKPGEFARTFTAHEDLLLTAICKGLGVQGVDCTCLCAAEVRRADLTLLVTEARDLMHGTDDWEWMPPPPLDRVIEPMAPGTAEAWFRSDFDALVREIAQEAAHG